MYKLLNFLFGWDYVAWKNSADQGVARIHKNPDGVAWMWRYRITDVLDIITSDNITNTKGYGITVTFLTCKSSKYV